MRATFDVSSQALMSFLADRWREDHGHGVRALSVRWGWEWTLLINASGVGSQKWKLGLSSDQATPESLGPSRAMGHLSLRKCSEEYRSGMEMSRYIRFSACLECVSSLCSE